MLDSCILRLVLDLCRKIIFQMFHQTIMRKEDLLTFQVSRFYFEIVTALVWESLSTPILLFLWVKMNTMVNTLPEVSGDL